MKNNLFYECTECGAQYTKWQGRCDECGKWNTIIEVAVSSNSKSTPFETKLVTHKYHQVKTENVSKYKTDIAEFDRVLGGGFVLGQVILLAGEPGIG